MLLLAVRVAALVLVIAGAACGDGSEATRAALLDTTFLSAGDVAARPRDSKVSSRGDSARLRLLNARAIDDSEDEDRVDDDSRRSRRDKAKKNKRRGRDRND